MGFSTSSHFLGEKQKEKKKEKAKSEKENNCYSVTGNAALEFKGTDMKNLAA